MNAGGHEAVQGAAAFEIAYGYNAVRREPLDRLEQRATLLRGGGSHRADDRDRRSIRLDSGLPAARVQSFCNERGARSSGYTGWQPYQPDGGIDTTTGGAGFAGHLHSLRPERADRAPCRRDCAEG